MAMTQANAICIERGTAYGPEYVNRLYSGVRRNLSVPVRFFSLAEIREGQHPEIKAIDLPDEPWPEEMNAALAKLDRYLEMRKVSLFRPGMIPDLNGPLPEFDLDVAIMGPLDTLLSTQNQRGYVGKLESASQSRERIRNFKKVSVVYPLNSDVFEILSTCQTRRCRVFRQPQRGKTLASPN